MIPRIHLVIFLSLLLSHFACVFVSANEEELEENIYKGPKTGSWANCTNDIDESAPIDHLDSSYTKVSCNNIHYRIPQKSLVRIEQSIVIGVLSGSAMRNRRDVIRSTWGYKKNNIFFIVGGKFEDIEREYNRFGDLLWIDKEEVYVTETSVLTFKTESFLSIMYERVMKLSDNVRYLFKTDDDSYINIRALNSHLLNDKSIDYYGHCRTDIQPKPHRNNVIPWQKKWYISYDVYPEPYYPYYCKGAGYALSKRFMNCASRHIAKIRYLPNEDVAVGMLAERCNFKVTNDDRIWIRWEDEDGISMDGKIVQHYVKSEEEMRLHHKSTTGVRGVLL